MTKVRKILMMFIIFVVMFCIISMGVTHFVYSGNFERVERPSDDTHAFLLVEDVLDYPREKVQFVSQKNTLQGYLYHQENAAALVVIVHGLGGGADSYLPHMKWFFDEGFSVFMFDATGSYDSEGNTTNGFPQILIDLENALDYLNQNEKTKDLDVVVFGHSWGGYAAINSPNLSDNVKAIISVSAPSNANDMIFEQAQKQLGFFTYLQKPFLELYQSVRFGKYASYDGIEAINQSNIPTMLIHGSEDEMVDISKSAAMSKKEDISIDTLVTIIVESEGSNNHNFVLRSENAITYIESVNKTYKAIYEEYNGEVPKEIRSDFYNNIDRELAQELSEVIMSQIKAFILSAIE